MLYSSPEYFVFLFCVLSFYCIVGRSHIARFWILTVASLFFYSWAGLFDSLIFFFVVLVSWISIWLADRSRKRSSRLACLAGGIGLMALHLFFWKYAPWVVSVVQGFYPGFLGGSRLTLPLPVGISFFTLQGIAYLIDYGRGQAEYIGFRKFLLFKSFFPQLIAGPIVRLYQLEPQLERLPRPNWTGFQQGISLFALGFFKKVALADRMAGVVDPVFETPSSFTAKSIIWATLAYTVQIWGDFSGYTDMGRGSAMMLGITLPENFLSPYLSRAPSEFWRRWHVTLSQWIRDYIYIPMGGAKGGLLKVTAVALTTMVISGLWHGAAFPFLVWGIYHGALLVLERMFRIFDLPVFQSRLGIPVFFALTVLGWLIFRSSNVEQSLAMAKIVLGLVVPGESQVAFRGVAWALVCCFGLQLLFYRSLEEGAASVGEKLFLGIWERLMPRFPRLLSAVAGGAVAVAIITTLLMRPGTDSVKFIYFQF